MATAGESSSVHGEPGSGQGSLVQYRKKVPPPAKCDDPGRLVHFFKIFEKWCRSEFHEDRESWVQVLPSFVGGEILRTVQAFPPDAEYDTIKFKILTNFVQTTVVTGNLYRQVLDMKRRSDEGIRCFLVRLEGMVSKLGASEEGSEAIIRSVLENNIHKKVLMEIQKQSCMRDGLTVEEFMKAAESISNILGVENEESVSERVRVCTGEASKHPGSPQTPVVCYRCGKEGHFSRECSSKQDTSRVTCFNCQKKGHLARNCRQPERSSDRNPTLPTCGFCGKYGHAMMVCGEFQMFRQAMTGMNISRESNFGPYNQDVRQSGDRSAGSGN